MDTRARARHAMLLCTLVLCADCTPASNRGIEGVPGFGTSDAGAPAPGEDPEPLAYGVVASDRIVTSIALLEADGTLLRRDLVDSGSAPPGLVTALSGDVVLPTRSGDPETLTLID